MRDFKAYKTDEGICCYSCNSPDDDTLKKNKVQAIGEIFGIDAKEVLLLPYKLFKGMFIRSDVEIEQNAQKIIRNLK